MTNFRSPTDRDEDLELLTPQVEGADLKQEMAILTWLGRKPRKDLVYRRLHAAGGTYLLFGDEEALGTEGAVQPMPWSIEPEPRVPTPAEILTDWAADKHPSVQRLIESFVEDPREDDLPQIIRTLRRRNLLAAKPSPGKSGGSPLAVGSLIQTLYTAIQQDPKTIEELYTLTRQVHSAKRPEAACRQALRRLLSQNLIQKTLDEHYRAI